MASAADRLAGEMPASHSRRLRALSSPLARISKLLSHYGVDEGFRTDTVLLTQGEAPVQKRIDRFQQLDEGLAHARSCQRGGHDQRPGRSRPAPAYLFFGQHIRQIALVELYHDGQRAEIQPDAARAVLHVLGSEEGRGG